MARLNFRLWFAWRRWLNALALWRLRWTVARDVAAWLAEQRQQAQAAERNR